MTPRPLPRRSASHGSRTSRIRARFESERGSSWSRRITAFRLLANPRDGKLLVAGSEDAKVSVHDLGSRNILRSFRTHSAPVHVAKFSGDAVSILSGSDDKTLRRFDLPTEREVACFRGHSDYVRCAQESPVRPELWLSGSYDHIVKVWDTRTGGSSSSSSSSSASNSNSGASSMDTSDDGDASDKKQRHSGCVMSMDHGAPVEALLTLPGGTLLATAGNLHLACSLLCFFMHSIWFVCYFGISLCCELGFVVALARNLALCCLSPTRWLVIWLNGFSLFSQPYATEMTLSISLAVFHLLLPGSCCR